MKVFCYGQQCSSRNGGIVPESDIDRWSGENPEKWEEGEFCHDWDLIGEGTEEEIVRDMRERLTSNTAADSNAAFRRRQCRNVLEMFGRPETPARRIDSQAYIERGLIELIGTEFEREEIESDFPETVSDLTGWYPYTKVWKITDGEYETFYAVA